MTSKINRTRKMTKMNNLMGRKNLITNSMISKWRKFSSLYLNRYLELILISSIIKEKQREEIKSIMMDKTILKSKIRVTSRKNYKVNSVDRIELRHKN
jgi:hypothetical protein